MIKNLHHSIQISEIIEAIESTGNSIEGKTINVKYGSEKKQTLSIIIDPLK